MGLIDEIRRENAQRKKGNGAAMPTTVEVMPSPAIVQPAPVIRQAAQPTVHEQMAGFTGNGGGFGLGTYHIIPYSSFAGRTGEILSLQNQLHRMVLAKMQPIWAIPIQLYEYIQESLFGKRKIPIAELFARELASVRSLNGDLEKVLSSCHMYVDDMTKFRGELYGEAAESNQSISAMRAEIGKRTQEYDALNIQLSTITNPLSEKSLQLDQRLERVEDERNNAYLKYVLALERISDDIADVRISKDLKRMFIVNYFMYQRMCERVKRMDRRLSHVIGPYLMMIQIQEVGKEVYKQLSAVTSFSRDLHQLASTGISDAIRMLRSSTTEMYDNPSNDLTITLNQLQTENAIVNQQLEERTKRDIQYLRER